MPPRGRGREGDGSASRLIIGEGTGETGNAQAGQGKRTSPSSTASLAFRHAPSDWQSAGKDLYTFPLRETRRTAPHSRYASARKPSYFTSNSQSGWSKGWRRSESGIGLILGIGNHYQFSWAGQSRASRPGLAGLFSLASGCLPACLRLDDSTDPITMPNGTPMPSASLIFDLRGPGIPGGSTPKSAERGSALPMRISFKSYENCLPQARQTT